jgi:hypothetical protein
MILAAVAFMAVAAYAPRLQRDRTDRCAASSTAAVAVRPVIDARTGASIPDRVASAGTLIVRDGAYADTTPLLAGAAPDRPGSYAVAVHLPGYREWRRSGVEVSPRPCSVRTTYLRVVLQPSATGP